MAEPEHIGDIIESGTGKLENNPVQASNNDNDNSSDNVPVKGNPEGLPTKGKLGGPRPGGGRPPGRMNRASLDNMKVKEALNQRILGAVDKLYNAQMNLAIGEQVLMRKVTERGPKGGIVKVYHEQVTDIETIIDYLDENEGMPGTINGENDEWYYLSTRPANNMALDSLMNRALGKVPDKVEHSGGLFHVNKLIIEVIGSKHADIEFADNGDVIYIDGGSDGGQTPTEPTPEISA